MPMRRNLNPQQRVPGLQTPQRPDIPEVLREQVNQTNQLPTPQQAQEQGGFFSQTPPSNLPLPLLRPEQQQYQNFILQQLPGLLQNIQGRLGQPATTSQFDFGPIAQQARTQFQTQTVPTLAERFGALGGESRGSSAVLGQLGAAGAGLDESLASLGQQYGMQQQAFNYGAQQNQVNQLMSLLSLLSGQGLGRSTENIYDPGRTAGWQQGLNSLLGGLGNVGGRIAGAYLGGGF